MGLWKSNLEIFLDNKELNKGDILTLERSTAIFLMKK
jgi:hypothetical protein